MLRVRTLSIAGFYGVLCILLISWYHQSQRVAYVGDLEQRLTEQQSKVAAAVEAVSQQQTNEALELVVRDCTIENRTAYQQLFENLETLSASELATLQPLFDACARYFAEVDAVRVRELEYQVRLYDTYRTLYTPYGTIPVREQLGYEPAEIVAVAKERNQLLHQLVDIQQMIITTLQTEPENQAAISGYIAEAADIESRVIALKDRLRTSIAQP